MVFDIFLRGKRLVGRVCYLMGSAVCEEHALVCRWKAERTYSTRRGFRLEPGGIRDHQTPPKPFRLAPYETKESESEQSFLTVTELLVEL